MFSYENSVQKFRDLGLPTVYTSSNSLIHIITWESHFLMSQHQYATNVFLFFCPHSLFHFNVFNLFVLYLGVCGELFTDNGVLQNHLRSHQETTTRLFSCSLCGVVYANRQQLETHMQTHMSQQAAAPTGTVTLQTAAAVAAAAAAQQTTNVGGGQPAQAAAAAGGQVAGGGQAAALNGETRVSINRRRTTERQQQTRYYPLYLAD